MNEIITRVRNGDREAYRLLVQEYGPMVRMFLSGRLSNSQTVDDLSQEIFVTAYWNLDKFKIDADFAPWLMTISRNKLRSYFRSYYSQKNSVNVLNCEINDELLADLPQTSSKQLDVLEQLEKCLRKQPENCSSLLRARYFDNESVTHMAERLQTTVSSISSSLYRIRKQLRQCIEFQR